MRNQIQGVVKALKVPDFLSTSTVISGVEPRKVVAEKSAGESVSTQPKASDMVHHGFGVYEDHKGDIWYSEDGFIYKNATMEEDRTVQRLMDNS